LIQQPGKAGLEQHQHVERVVVLGEVRDEP
jgi:hypothetical protein